MNKIFIILWLSLLYAFPLFAQIQVGNDIDGEAPDDQSGSAVSISADGTRVAIGAPSNDGNGSSSGHVRVYEQMGGVWTQLGGDIDGEAPDDQSGSAVSISADGTRIAIGAQSNDGNGPSSGHVRVYEETGGVWTQLGGDIDGEATINQSGFAVSMNADGTRVAIGAPSNDGNGSGSGHVRVYEETGGVWTQLGGDIDGEAAIDLSGWAVSISADGTRVAIGAIFNDGNGSNSGHVRVYEETGGVWTQLGGDIDGEALDDQSGWAVSISADGTRIAIGARNNDGNGSRSGHVRVYEETGGVWTQLGGDIDGESVNDRSGSAVSISADGTRIAIGAPFNDGNGADSGHVRVYEEMGGVWTQLRVDIDGEAPDDQSGEAVSISADGTRIAIGAPFNGGNGFYSGHVRVFEITNVLPVELIQFSARSINKGIALQWKTASETNNKGFELQKSKDGEKWEPLTFIIGKGTTTLPQVYEFLDTDISSEFNYYRLKQIDFDERFEYSEILAVVIDPLASDISFYPNPTRDKINLLLNNPKQVTVYTALGIVLDRFELEVGDQELFLKKYGQSILLLQVGEEWLRVVVEE